MLEVQKTPEIRCKKQLSFELYEIARDFHIWRNLHSESLGQMEVDTLLDRIQTDFRMVKQILERMG